MNRNPSRLHHIDLLRGLIIVLMVLDHAMVYCVDYLVNDPMDVPGTEPRIFLSRFLSHFCAPLFIFLAGLSAALTELRYPSSVIFAKDLILRGLVLILLEFTIVSWSWSFNPLFPMLYAQVIWAIGWGFIFLGITRLVDVRLVLITGLIIVFGHNLLDDIRFQENSAQHYVWSVLHQKNVLPLPFEFRVRTTYPIMPVIGLMCLAYMAGRHYVLNGFSAKIEQNALRLGMACLLGYGLLRGFNLYGDPGEFTVHSSYLHTLMSFFNPTKYPLSLQYMLLTVGAGLVLLFYFRRLPSGFSSSFLQVLGKTSMFSYIVHLYLLHIISWLLIPVFGFALSDMTYGRTLIGLPEGFGFSYAETYVFATVVVLLTTLLARPYIVWKSANKGTLIARYI